MKHISLGWLARTDRPRGPASPRTAPSARAWRIVRPLLIGSLLIASQTGATRAAGPRTGGTIVYGITQNIDSFIPVVSPTSILDDEAQVLLYRPLFYIGPSAQRIGFDRR